MPWHGQREGHHRRMDLAFDKLHGCGNDYIYLDGLAQELPADLSALARRLADRHTGIGGDGLIVLGPGSPQAPVSMTMFNADGSPSAMCGNGLRCCARLARDHGHVAGEGFPVLTGAGLRHCRLLEGPQGLGSRVACDMGPPVLVADAIPWAPPTAGSDRLIVDLPGLGPVGFRPIGMGNPHAVASCLDAPAVDLARVGPLVEHHPSFPERTNVEFSRRLADENGRPVLRQRTWERGSGITRACGSGACAVAVAAILEGSVAPGEVVVRLDGGDLVIAWDGDHHHPVRMTGEAIRVFTGTVVV